MDQEETTMMTVEETTTLPEEMTMEEQALPVPAWAERLAQRVRHAHEPVPPNGPSPEEWIPGATAVLWAQFDEAVRQANAALEQSGLSERIAVRHAGDEYWLTAPGPLGGERSIAVFARLRAVKGQVSGGAQITMSETRATVYLTPSIAGGRLRWVMPRTGTEFTARVVDDLLLSVFGNDPAATQRLSPSFSLDEGL
jgi:hypothetical protein